MVSRRPSSSPDSEAGMRSRLLAAVLVSGLVALAGPAWSQSRGGGHVGGGRSFGGRVGGGGHQGIVGHTGSVGRFGGGGHGGGVYYGGGGVCLLYTSPSPRD